MNRQFQKQPDFKQQQGIQSFYEPALRVLNEIPEQEKLSLRKKGYDENNAAVTKIELSQLMAQRFRITIYLADQIVSSLVKSNAIESFGGYVKPKAVEV